MVVDDYEEPMPFERFDPGFGFAPVERVCVRLRLLNELALYLVWSGAFEPEDGVKSVVGFSRDLAKVSGANSL